MNKLKITGLIERRLAPVSGAEISLLELSGLLKEQGAEISLYGIDCLAERKQTEKLLELMEIPFTDLVGQLNYNYEGIPVTVLFEDNFSLVTEKYAGIIEQEKPDIIFSFFISPLIYQISLRFPDIPVIYFVHSHSFTRPGDKIQPGMKSYVLRQKHIFVSSEFMQEQFELAWGIKPYIIRDYISREKYLAPEKNPRYITLINPAPEKGLEIFLKLAAMLPEEKFLAVGGWKTHKGSFEKITADYGNISYLEPTARMKDIYGITRLLLFPSLMQEGLGRVILEAFLNGIPVIASNRGALPETAGGEFCLSVDDPERDINDWLELIVKLSGTNFYLQASEKSKKVFEEYNNKCQESFSEFTYYLKMF